MIIFISVIEIYIDCMVLFDLIMFFILLNYEINKNNLIFLKLFEVNLLINFI